MNQLQKLFNYQGQQVRTIIKNGELWFVLKDVCDVLDLAHRVVRQRLSDDVCTTYPIQDALGRTQETTIINEDGLYDVILESRKPEARVFRKWITSEVLPEIRKTGQYSLQAFNLPKSFSEALRCLADEVEQHELTKQRLAITAPKAEMYDVALSAKNSMSMAIVAKTLGMGRNKLFELLREQKILRHNNEPYQEFIDRGYFTVRQVPIQRSLEVQNKSQTLVTAKGMDYIGKLLKKNNLLKKAE